MMGYLDRLKAMNSEKCLPSPLPKPSKAPYGGFDSSQGGRFQKIAPPEQATPEPARVTSTASRWWLIHYPDREPLEAACFPPATHAEILGRHPEAIAAEPFGRAKPEPDRACSTCAHVTGRGGCGEAVAAGLSDGVGVIRYHAHQGAGCLAWLATLDDELERRILAMAERWNYSGDDLALALGAARSDPEGWRRVVEIDERGQ